MAKRIDLTQVRNAIEISRRATEDAYRIFQLSPDTSESKTISALMVGQDRLADALEALTDAVSKIEETARASGNRDVLMK